MNFNNDFNNNKQNSFVSDNLKKYYETHFVAHLHDGLSNTMKNLKPYMLIGIAA